MSDLIISVSGLRGRIGSGLTATVATEYAAAFATWLGGGKVIVGRDSRPSGAMIASAVMAGLAEAGCDPIELGLAATPTTGFLVRHLGAAGGVEITASHNPPEWNGIKLFHRDGRVLNAAEVAKVKVVFESRKFATREWNAVGMPNRHGDPHAAHLQRILATVDANAIRNRGYHVVLDANHGVGGILGARLLAALGCRVTTIGGTPDGAFAHPPEPVPENLKMLSQAVRENQADVGFALDPDADRLAIVDGAGRPIGEEYTIALVADHVLAKTPGTVVVNLSTTRAINDVAAARRSKCERSPVGEANVVELMLKRRAVIGGEGNGGVIHPQVVLVRDSFTGMALVLEAMAIQDASVALLVRRLPQFAMVKEKITVNPAKLPVAIKKIAAKFKKAKANRDDGLRLDWPDRWTHVRTSNTEPIARIITEAATEEAAQQLAADVRKLLAMVEVKPKKPARAATPKPNRSRGGKIATAKQSKMKR